MPYLYKNSGERLVRASSFRWLQIVKRDEHAKACEIVCLLEKHYVDAGGRANPQHINFKNANSDCHFLEMFNIPWGLVHPQSNSYLSDHQPERIFVLYTCDFPAHLRVLLPRVPLLSGKWKLVLLKYSKLYHWIT